MGWALIVITLGVSAVGGVLVLAALLGGPKEDRSPVDPRLRLGEHYAMERNGVRYLVGEVRNVGGNLRSASIEFELLDTAGRKVGTASDRVNGLGPGQTWRFEALAAHDNYDSHRLQSLSGY